MKKILSIVLSLLLVCSLAPISAFAASEDQSTAKVGVFVEVVDEDLSSLYDFSTPRRARSVVDLSAGQDTTGKLYLSDEYIQHYEKYNQNRFAKYCRCISAYQGYLVQEQWSKCCCYYYESPMVKSYERRHHLRFIY